MPNLIPIASADDPRVEAYRQIRDRDLAGAGPGRAGRFVAEGAVVIRLLLASPRFRAESLFIAENRLPGLADALDGMADDVPVYVAPVAVLSAVAGFDIHRGMLAIGLRGAPADPAAVLAAAGELPVVGLVGLSNHDNVGSIFRNAAAFGAGAVLLDRTSCDPLYRKALRVSVGGVLKVPFAHVADGVAMVQCLRDAGYQPFGLSPAGREEIGSFRFPPRSALLLGSEGPGLPAALLATIPTVRIEMAPGFDSLNVATASGIALHRLHLLASASSSTGRDD